jgi:hypothetical protein
MSNDNDENSTPPDPNRKRSRHETEDDDYYSDSDDFSISEVDEAKRAIFTTWLNLHAKDWTQKALSFNNSSSKAFKYTIDDMETHEGDPIHLQPNQPKWMPTYKNNVACLHLLHIETDPKHGGTGLGRLLINMIQQYITTSTASNQKLVFWISNCHMPIFYLTDSHYHWITTTQEDSIPPDTPPRSIYPAYLDIVGLPDDPEYEHMKAVNREAIYAPVDMQWHPPVEWAASRSKRIENLTRNDEVKRIAQMAYSVIGKMQTWLCYDKEDIGFHDNVNVAYKERRPALRTFVHEQNLMGLVDCVKMQTNLLSHLLGANTRNTRVVARTCRLLGNMDTFSFDNVKASWITTERTTSTRRNMLHFPNMNDVRAFYFNLYSFVFVPDIHRPHALLFIRLILAYVIDYCRVVYRPVILSGEFVKWLARELQLDDLNYPLGESQFMPEPSPYFAYLEDSQCWLWVPQKKPHSTTWHGDTLIPLPLLESPPLFEEEEERMTKKPRLYETRCLQCLVMLGQRKEGNVFCSHKCRSVYLMH